MQSASDRDEHVKIAWNHIINGTQSNFNKYNTSVVTDFGIPYDYNSIMHYGAYAFTKDGYATIIPNVSSHRLLHSHKIVNAPVFPEHHLHQNDWPASGTVFRRYWQIEQNVQLHRLATK